MIRVFPALVAGLCVASPANAQLYDFAINRADSGLSGPLSVDAQTSGTLIGDYDPATNPAGTRTKPGLFGTFGDAENVAVPASLGFGLGGPIDTATAGAFRLDLDLVMGSLTMTNFTADFLSGGSVNLPITLSLLFDSFRTRNPSSTYVSLGVPLSLPIGSASLTRLEATQVGAGTGVLTPTGAGTYDFSLAAVMLVSSAFSVLDNGFALPAQEIPIGFAGSLAIDGASAVLTSFAPLVFATDAQPGLALPQFPLPLPTILPPGSTASLLLDLTLTNVGISFDGSSAFSATGVLVPLPGAGWLLAAGLAMLGWRRRA
jgi:hypothetical protein